jgi:hypothetical protein
VPELAQACRAAMRVASAWLSVIPLVLCGGARLFGDARIPALQLQGVHQFQRGIVELRYALT